ncbi:MAG: polymerase subunit epsilon [Clostridia bacterium]|nr:polymerase subunit epsilon [Clostridia bacterium]
MVHSWKIGGFIDVETTGLSYKKDEIVEFAIILFSFDLNTGHIIEIIDEYSGMREPSCPINWMAAKIHGITKRKVCGMSLDDSKIKEMINQAEFLAAHNAGFDYGFVSRYMESSAWKPWYCSMNGVDWKGMGFTSRGLQNLLKYHGIEIIRAHRALDDAKAALLLLSCSDTKGETYLKKMLKNGPYINKIKSDYIQAPLNVSTALD